MYVSLARPVDVSSELRGRRAPWHLLDRLPHARRLGGNFGEMKVNYFDTSTSPIYYITSRYNLSGNP